MYGKPEKLQSGEVRTVDETLIREAILTPNSVLVPGFAPVMPTYPAEVHVVDQVGVEPDDTLLVLIDPELALHAVIDFGLAIGRSESSDWA